MVDTTAISGGEMELDDAYDEYLKTIHRIACKHLLKTQAVLGYLGQFNRARGVTCTITSADMIWELGSSTPIRTPPPDSVNATAPVTGRIPPRKLAKPSKFDPVAWSNKINTDVSDRLNTSVVAGTSG
ncbi:hypothetical protein KEM48_013412 [Puccinia striiformis f. sp. tritici PST-130]|nr:hypothetical protein KEM48_013412 [Puccinia striiformis f. sp. tritici PST-130]